MPAEATAATTSHEIVTSGSGCRIRGVADVVAAGAWLLLIWPSFAWLASSLAQPNGRLNLVLLVVVGCLLLRGGRKQLRIGAHSGRAPVGVLLLAGLGYVLVESSIGLHHLSAYLAGVGSYGLAALFLPRPAWRRGLVPLLLLLALLPCTEHLDVFLGFPARVLTARWVHDLLPAEVAGRVSAETILVLENGLAQVDLPCSGIKSLWSGLVCCLAVTWLERRRLGLLWLAAGAGYVLLLLTANLARVYLLVMVDQVLGWPVLAAMVHRPLGLLGFIAATLLYRQLACRTPGRAPAPDSPLDRVAPAPDWSRVVVLAGLSGLLLVNDPLPQPRAVAIQPQLVLPAELAAVPVTLNQVERKHFTQQGSLLAHKVRFAWRGRSGSLVSGSLLIVASGSYRAHHPPERCLTAMGLAIERRATLLLAPSFPVRRLVLRNHPGDAVFWFQSAQRVTEDYGARVWADLTGPRQRWVLVSFLLDRSAGPELDPDLRQLLLCVRDAIATSQLLAGNQSSNDQCHHRRSP